MAEKEDGKIVQPGTVQFTGDGPKADDLETAVNIASSFASGGSPSGSIANMEFLAQQTAYLFETTYGTKEFQNQKSHDLTPVLTAFIPYAITLTIGNELSAQISLGTVAPSILRSFLEEVYGPEIAQTGIYEATGLTGTTPINISDVITYFPEFQVLHDLNGRFVMLNQDPFQTILSFDVSVRDFFTGATKTAGLTISSLSQSNDFFRPLTLKNILDYAKQTGEVAKVKEYTDVYRGH